MHPGSPRPTPLVRLFIYTLFAVVTAGALWVPLYNRIDPVLGGVPFFYWFQLAWIVVAAGATALAYRLKL